MKGKYKKLFALCEEMEEENDYDIDFKKYVINVFGEKDTYLRDLEKTYNVSAMFGIDTD